jgi:putative hydrolase of HD superfamily
MLTGRYTSTSGRPTNETDFRAQKQPRFQPDNIESNLKLVEAIKEIAARRRCVAAQAALAWVLGQGDHIVAIPYAKQLFNKVSFMKIEALIGFLKEVEKFKACERTCQTTSHGRAESDAEHSWHLAVFLLLLEKEFGEIDFTKTLKMALIHDLPEIYAGDTNPYRGDTGDKEVKEKEAARQLFGSLPEEVSQTLAALFDEYLAQETDEAKFVKAADKLMPLIQNLCTNESHSSYRKLNVRYEEVVAYMDQFFSDGILHRFYQRLLSEAHQKGVFSSPGH